MHVWRFPLANFAALLAFCTIIIAWELAALFRRRANTNLVRGLLVAGGTVVTLLSPLLVHALVDPELRDLASRGVYAHYGPAIYVGPAVAGALLFFVSRRTIPSGTPRVALARCVFWMTAAALAALNLANWCSPGWCERFGFPFPYSWWSDAIVVMNGVNLSAGTSALAVMADIVVLLVAVILLPRAVIRRTV